GPLGCHQGPIAKRERGATAGTGRPGRRRRVAARATRGSGASGRGRAGEVRGGKRKLAPAHNHSGAVGPRPPKRWQESDGRTVATESTAGAPRRFLDQLRVG